MLFVCFVELDDSVTTAIIPDFCSIVLTVRWIPIDLALGANLYHSSPIVFTNCWDQLACQKSFRKRTITDL